MINDMKLAQKTNIMVVKKMLGSLKHVHWHCNYWLIFLSKFYDSVNHLLGKALELLINFIKQRVKGLAGIGISAFVHSMNNADSFSQMINGNRGRYTLN
jgi:hypothetical protein